MNRSLAAFTAVALLSGGTAKAQTTPVLNPANGHYYQYVSPAAFTFQQALTAAQSASYLGIPGHLLTITSGEEDSFVSSAFPSNGGWIGASDAAVEGEWRWVAGPEAGQLFYKHVMSTPAGYVIGTAYGYERWSRRPTGDQVEPNNIDTRLPPPKYGPENYGIRYSIGTWNDLAGDWKNGYFVEYSTVPEPSGFVLACAAVILSRIARRRHA